MTTFLVIMVTFNFTHTHARTHAQTHTLTHARTRTHTCTHTLVSQCNGTEEKVFEKRKVFKEELKVLTEVE